MNSLKSYSFSILFFICFIGSVQAQTNESTPTTEQPGWFKKTVDNAVHITENLYDNGHPSVILSGYAYHGRGTYTPEKIHELNERAWGLGYSKELRDEKDNEESIQLLAISDSHRKIQVTLGYSYQWMKPLGGNWEAGIGYTAGLISRADILNNIPFPGILPLFTFGTRDTKLVMSYIPTINGKDNGNVLYLALRTSLK